MTTGKAEFLIEEYKALREEILFHAKHSRWLESTIIIGTAAIYAWASKKNFNGLFALIWWIPFVVTILGAIREYATRVRNMQIAEYIQEIELYFKTEENAANGWESRLKGLREKLINRPLTISAVLFWSVLITFTLVVGIIYSL